MKAQEYLPAAIGQALDLAGFQFGEDALPVPVPVHSGGRFPPKSPNQPHDVEALLRGPSVLIAWDGTEGCDGGLTLDAGEPMRTHFSVACRHRSAEGASAMADAILCRLQVDGIGAEDRYDDPGEGERAGAFVHVLDVSLPSVYLPDIER